MNDKEKRDLMLRFAAENKGVWPSIEDEAGYDGGLILAKCLKDYRDGPDCFGYRGELKVVGAMCDTDFLLPICTRTEFEALMQELAEGAPDGAERYNPKVANKYLKKTEKGIAYFFSGTWAPYLDINNGKNHWDNAIPLPKTEPKKWMPEVGQECEVQDVDKGWILGKAIAFDEDENVMVFKTKHGYSGYSDFRRLRTEAEKEREVLALKLFRAIAKNNKSSDDLAKTTYLYKDCLSAIDDGWRPQEQTND